MRIAVDVASGESPLEELVRGSLRALSESKDISLIFVGDSSRINSVISKNDKVDTNRIRVLHTSEIIEMDDSPVKAIKHKHNASVTLAARLVGRGEAEAFFSPGNTGATLTASLMEIGRLKGILRPALLTMAPRNNGDFCILDVGANSDCTVDYLSQFAVMGHVFAKRFLNIRNPKIGLLNIGEEDSKGNSTTKKAFEKLSKMNLNFIGNVEPNDMFKNDYCDVLVCDGFDGNIVIKTMEGTAKFMMEVIKNEVKRTPLRMVGAKLLKPAFKKIKQNLNADAYGAATLIGVKGGAFIGHGRTTEIGIKNALLNINKFLEAKVNEHLLSEISEAGAKKRIF